MKKILSLILTLCMLLSVMPTTFGVFAEEVTEAESTEGESTVTITPAFTVSPGLDTLKFNTSNLPSGGWAAIYTADITEYKTANPSNPDAGYADWIYVYPTDTSITFPSGDSSRHFNWPLHTGDWKVVVFADGGYTKPVATAEFSVVESTTLTLDNETPKVGETISFSFDKSTSDNDWIAIYDASYTDATEYIEYVYTEGESGTVELTEEYPEGNYVAVYYHDNSYLALETIKFAVTADKEVDPNGIYVSAAGSDTNAGTPDAPIKTIAKAIELKGTDADFTIYVMGASYSFGTDIAHTGTITLEPYDVNASLAGGDIKLNGPTKIHVNTAKAVNFYPNGYYFELDGDVNRSIHNNLFVGNSEGRDNVVDLNGQYIRYLACFDDNAKGTEDTLITIDGTEMYMVCHTSKTAGAPASYGNLRVVVNSGEIQFINVYELPANTAQDASAVYVFNNGAYNVNPHVFGGNTYTTFADFGSQKIWFKEGHMVWKSMDTDGNYILPKSITEYEVVGEKTAYYQTSDKTTIYYSVDGKLTLPNLGIKTSAGSKFTTAEVLWTDNFSTDNFTLPEGANYWKETAEGVYTASYYTPDDIYVSLNGSDGADGVGTEEAPLATIAEAIKRKGTDVDFTIYIMDANYIFADDIAHTGTITYAPYNETASFAGGTIKIDGPSIFNINTAAAVNFYSNGHYLEIDGDINKSVKNTVHIGTLESTPEKVVLKGLYFDAVYTNIAGQQGGDVDIIIDGADVFNCRPAAGALGSVKATVGKVRVTVNSGVVFCMNSLDSNTNTTSDGYMEIVFNNNTHKQDYVWNNKTYTGPQLWYLGKINFAGGDSIYYNTDTNGNTITPTTEKGVYAVDGTKIAWFQSADKKTAYYTYDGKITLPVESKKTINWADSFSTSLLSKPADGDMPFIGWEDDGKGTITAKYLDYYHVASTGSDDNVGSADAPLATVAKAIEKKGAAKDQTIIIMDTVVFNDIAHTGEITYVPLNETSGSFNSNVSVNGPSIIKVPIAHKFTISTNGHKIVMASPVEPTSKIVYFVAGNTAGTDEVVYLNGGSYYNNVYTRVPDQKTGDVKFIIDGALVRMIAPGTNTSESGDIVITDIDVVVNSGELHYLNKGSQTAVLTADAALEVVFNNNTASKFKSDYLGSDKMTFTEGKWFIKSADTTGNALDTTDTTGKYEVIGGNTAYVVSSDKKKVYYSVDGYLTLPKAGTYNVLYAEDFSKETVAAPEGANGWLDDGNGTLYADFTPENIYVSASGDDSAAGVGTEEAPLATIAEAIRRKGANEDFTIYVMGAKYSFGEDIPHTGTITLEPADDTATLAGGTIKLNGPTKIHVNNAGAIEYYPNGYYFELDGTVINRNIKSNVHVGNLDGRFNEVVLKGQFINNVYAHVGGQQGGETLITVDGAHLYQIRPSTATNSITPNATLGNLRVVINSGEFQFINTANDSYTGFNRDTDAYAVYVFNNDAFNITPHTVGGNFSQTQDWGFNKLWFKGGEMIWKSSDTDGNYIIPKSITEYDVVGTKTAYYQTSDKKTVYYSVDGKLTLPNLGIHTTHTTKATQANILWADEFSTDLLATPAAENGKDFVCWQDMGDGMLVARYYPMPTNFNYYVKAGATGDGTSVDSPAPTLAAVVNKINEDGHDATTGEVNVYIIDSGEPRDVGVMVQRADMKNYVTLNHTYNHTAKINFTTYDYANTNKAAVIYNTNDITPYTGKFHVMGNESYKDLIYIDTRTDFRMGIYIQGYDFELNNFTYRRLNISARTSEDLDGDGKSGQYGDNKVLHNQKTEAEIVTDSTAEILSYTNRTGTGTAGNGGRVILDGVSNYKDIFFGGYTDSSKGITIAGDQIIELNGVKNKAVVFSGCATSQTYNYNGDVSLVLNGTTGITFKSTAKANIAGAVQVILNNGSTFTPSFMDYAISTSGGDVPYYVMNSGSESGTLDATANAGEFKVNANGLYAYAFRECGREVYYGKDILKVTEDGEYTVKYVASVEDVIKGLDGVFTSDPTTGMLFKGWKDDGNGTLTAILEQKVPETKEYYVMYGGTGDGRSATAPAATVSAVVKSVNEDLIFGDTAKVYIMNSGDPLTDNVGKLSTRETLVKGTFTAWAEGGYQLSEKHYATLHITSYDANPDDGVAPAHTHLAYSEYIGANHSMALTGPVIFDNITIVRPRNVDREIYLGGNNVTFTDSVLIAQAKADFYQSVAFSGIEYAKNHIALGYGSAAHNNAQVVRINSPITAAGNNHGISLSSSANTNFNAPVSLYLNNEAINSQVSWSIGERITNFNAGLNIITDAIGTISYPSGNYAKGTVNVTGGLQMINNNGYKFPELPTNAVYDSLWIMNSEKDAGGTLDVTETAGTFKITEGKYAFVQSADNKTITYATGTITLPAGEYNVRYADSAASIMELATKPSDVDVYNVFDKWVDDGNGTMTAQYKYVINTYYVSATGSDDNDGATADTAYATIAKAIEAIEATGLNGLVFIIGDVKFAPVAHKQTVYYESYNGGTLAGDNNVITLAGPTSIKADFAAAQTIYMNGHDLILGGAVNTAEKNIIYAGNTAGVDANITLLGKFVDKIYTHVAAQQSGDINVVIEGGTLSQLITGTGVVNDGSYLVDSIRVTLNDGEFYSYTHTDNSAHKAAGTFEFVANGGKYYFDGERTVDGNTITEWFDDSPNGADGFVKIQYDAGKYVIRSADTENNLSVTETAGVYAYDGAKTPYYVSETGLNIYYGIDGKVKLTTGTVDVKWIDEFKADSMPAPELPDGFVFEGWTDDGNGILTANVIDPNFFYVDETKGKDTNNGSEAEPFKTVAHAIDSLKGKTGYVYVITSATYDVTDAHNGLVTIKGTSDASIIKFVGDVKLAGSTKLENITVELADNTVIGTNGNRFEISENVTVGDIKIATGVTDAISDKVVLQNTTADITVGDSDNTSVYVKDSTVGITLGDTDASSAVKVTADNTTITDINTAGKEFASLEVISNGKLIDAEVEVSDNTWYVSSEATDAVIDQTGTAGVYGVKAPYGKLPVAIGEDGKIYVADSYTSEDIAPDTWYERSSFDQYINYRKPLNNTYKKLTEDKELTVAYFGGSMTAGSGSSSPNLYSWRGLTGQWLKDNFPDANITNINRACGESGSYLGTFRLQTDVIAVKPDLMFLEYSINDKYYGSYYATAALQVETILREMKQVLPETDIVFVLVTDRSALATNKNGELHTQAQAHEDMATKYGYSTLHVGRRLAEYVNYDANVWPTYATDGVHLKDSGYRVYYDVIEEFMYNSLFCTDFEGLRERNEELLPVQSEHLMDGNRTHYQPTEELLKRSEELGGTGVTRSGGSSYGDVTESQGTFVLNSTDDVFAFEFDGTDAALWSNYYTGDMLLVSIDGGDYKAVSGSSHAPARIVEGLDSGKHTIKVKIADATESLSIRSIFTIDYTKSTLQGATHTYTDYANYTFTLPAGKYEVKYLDFGSTVADLGYEYAGEGLFLGLKDSEGNAVVDTTALTAGMVLVPELFDVNDYFSFKGAQIRVKTEDKDQGLRFVVEKLASVDEKVNVSEFGMVVIPSAILGDDRAYTDYDASVENSTANIVGADELVAGAVFTVNDKQYAVKTVVAEKIFEQGEDSLSYTTCITGVTSDKYAKYYTLKPYVKFTVDGVEYIEYADAFRSSIYEVAKAISADETAGEDVKAVAEEVISTVEQ